MKRSFLVALVVATIMLGSAMPALGAGRGEFVVGSDREECPQAQFARIQDAVNTAGPGSTIVVCPGTYREMVTIPKNDLRIVSQHGPGDVVVEGMPADPHNAQEAGFLLHMVSGVLIQGFTVRGFHESDILLEGANGNVIRNNRTTASAHDGIQLNHSSDNLVEDNVSFDNDARLPARAFTDACGVLLRLGSANNVVRHNEVFGNAFGILVAGASNGNLISHNDSHDNRRYGILTRGSFGTLIDRNEVEHNGVSSLGPGRGISMEASSDVNVIDNDAFENVVDLFWDGTGSNDQFRHNECDTSQPPGLCQDGGGRGDT